MLFNSYIFIFLFLPTTLVGFYLLGKYGDHRLTALWLVFTSLFFYGWWNPAYVALIIASILVNYSIGTIIANQRQTILRRRLILTIGISLNLVLLGYYKYANFFVDSLNSITNTYIELAPIVLPLAISFFTFQQIAYLVDTYQGKTKEYNFIHYCLFVTFFPQLIAGPIVHHKEMLPQFADRRIYTFNHTTFSAGITIFFLGLFKKVILADSAAEYATPIFNAASSGMAITIFESWAGALAYTFQLYFDFSAYSDMAVGIGLLFGIYLPLNFFSPYKATNIIEFWRRWHITLSRFLRDYLYIPLGGNRKGNARRYVNLIATMLLGGLWHGAGWTFILWGALHGFYLTINHLWAHLSNKLLNYDGDKKIWKITAGIITFLFVVIAWVLFRSENIDTALTMYQSMFGFNGLSLPESLIGKIGALEGTLIDLGVNFNGMFGNRIFDSSGILLLAALSVITWFLPNLQEIMGSKGALGTTDYAQPITTPSWSNTKLWAITVGVVSAIALTALSRKSEFLYFQF